MQLWMAGGSTARHRIGGPSPLLPEQTPRCPVCNEAMSFYAQLDGLGRCFEIGTDSLIFLFVCFDHGEVEARLQPPRPLARSVAETREVRTPPRFVIFQVPAEERAKNICPLSPFDEPLHQLGGDPAVPPADEPRCPACGEAMTFYAQLDSVGRCFELPGNGLILVHLCFEHLEVHAGLVPTARLVPASAARPVPPFDLVPNNRMQRALRVATGRGEPRHRLGGPSPLAPPDAPRCEHCKGEMSFYAQLDHGADCGGNGQLLVYVCFHHLSAAAIFRPTDAAAPKRAWRKPVRLDLQQRPRDEQAAEVRAHSEVPVARHRIGGPPPDTQPPQCARCAAPMRFYAQLDSIGVRYEIADLGLLAIWTCDEHRQAVVEISSC